jgi:PD-(D/E)XK nuclease superfamily
VDVNDMIDAKLVHEIHTSERRSFRACRRRWDWLFRNNLYPKTTAKPLEFGVAYHKAMEAYYNPDTWHFPRPVSAAYAMQVFAEKCEQQKREALLATGQTDLDPEVEADYKERVELGLGMLRYYFNDVAPAIDEHWTPVKVEVSFMVPILHPKTSEQLWCRCDLCWKKWYDYQEAKATQLSMAKNVVRKPGEFVANTMVSIGPLFPPSDWPGLPVVYAGRLDVLARDENGDLWIIDWKTARQIPDDHSFLDLDDQIGSYVWALNRLGIPVRGFVYHEQRKAFPQPPKENKQRRLGCKFSVAKNQSIDYATYLATVMQHDHEAWVYGYYNEILEYLQGEGAIEYYHREQIHKTPEELEEIGINIGLEALDMIDPYLRIYPSAGRFSCTTCAFRQPCMEKNRRGDYQYFLDTMFDVRVPYYVREEPSTESKGGE